MQILSDLPRAKRGKSHSLHLGTYKPKEVRDELDSDQKNDEKEITGAENSVDVRIPGIAKFVMKGQYGVTIAAMTILGIFVVERMFKLSMCIAKCQQNQQPIRQRLV